MKSERLANWLDWCDQNSRTGQTGLTGKTGQTSETGVMNQGRETGIKLEWLMLLKRQL